MDIPHVHQKTDWDCGIACIEMILRYNFGEKYENGHLENICEMLGFGQSVWSIDLVNVLVKCEIKCDYYTITHGVDPGYKDEQYYKDCFTNDQQRVNDLFKNAQQLGLNVIKRLVSIEEILLKLCQGYIAIALVDSTKLQCNYCETFILSNMDEPNYCGHYILLCGCVNKDEKQYFIYKNPSSEIPLCFINIDIFESAWHSYGTDNDIIFINLENKKPISK